MKDFCRFRPLHAVRRIHDRDAARAHVPPLRGPSLLPLHSLSPQGVLRRRQQQKGHQYDEHVWAYYLL